MISALFNKVTDEQLAREVQLDKFWSQTSMVFTVYKKDRPKLSIGAVAEFIYQQAR